MPEQLCRWPASQSISFVSATDSYACATKACHTQDWNIRPAGSESMLARIVLECQHVVWGLTACIQHTHTHTRFRLLQHDIDSECVHLTFLMMSSMSMFASFCIVARYSCRRKLFGVCWSKSWANATASFTWPARINVNPLELMAKRNRKRTLSSVLAN